MGKYVRCKIENEIATVTIDNPPVNAFSKACYNDFTETLEKLKPEKLRAAIITGAGFAFQAGADINEFLHMRNEQDGLSNAEYIHRGMNKLMELPFPAIAAVNGIALGSGTELALACDIRIASSKAIFGLPEVGLGVLPVGGGTQRLQRLIGTGMAKWLIFSGTIIDAAEALNIGLVEFVAEPEQVMPEALKIARRIAKQSPAAVRMAKKAMNEGMQMDLPGGLDVERKCFARLIGVGDFTIGATAFLEKRKPEYAIRD